MRWIESIADLPQSFLETDTWYVDTEFMRERTFHADLALVQIAAGHDIVLLDAPALEDPVGLGQLLANKKLVLHACSEDLEVLSHTTSTRLDKVNDTQLAAALVGFPLQTGYQKLVADLCGVELKKEATRSNWLKRPLTATQLDYAADDVRYLKDMANELATRLDKSSRWHWWQEECQRLVKASQQQTPASELWRQVKGAGHLQPDETARLQQLAIWRDQQARQRNKPRSFILKDKQLLTLSHEAPTQINQLEDLGLHPGLIRRHGGTLITLLKEADSLAPPPPMPDRLNQEQKQRCSHWKSITKDKAAELGVVPEVLARRRWLEELARAPEKLPVALSGWRYDVITRHLLTAY